MKKTFVLATLLTATFATANASAQSLEIKKKRAEAEAIVKEKLDYMNDKCGTKATVTIDWASFKDENIGKADTCKDLPDTVWWAFCGEGKEMEKEAVQKGVKKMVCKFDNTKDTDKQQLTAKGGTVTWTWGGNAANVTYFIKDELSKQL